MNTKVSGISQRSLRHFIEAVNQLNPIEFMGLLKILEVDIYENQSEINKDTKIDDIKPRPFEDLIEDLMVHYALLGRAQRRELMTVMKQAIKERKKENGSSTKD